MTPPANHKNNDPLRGSVNKQYRTANVLAGFMDDAHFHTFAQEPLGELSGTRKRTLLNNVNSARAYANGLPPHADFSAEARPLDPKFTERFATDKTFAAAFDTSPHRFSWVRPESLVALQVYVLTPNEAVPTSEAELIDYALPGKWGVPAEISFIPPLGPIYVVSSSPHLTGLTIQMDNKKGRVIIEPPAHLNLIQVVQFCGRYYLRNGYHRVAGALAAGVAELPALVIDAHQPPQVDLPQLGAAGFGVIHSMTLARPPLVSDFTGPGTVDIQMRERRYGASVSLQISPVNIGV